MKMNINGFKLSSTSDVYSVNDFLKVLSTLNIEHSDISSENETLLEVLGVEGRYIFLKKSTDFWYGLVVTIKDNTKFSALKKNKSSWELIIHSLAKDENIAEFNFFIYNSLTRIGLYQQYHNSCSTICFCKIITKIFFKHIENKLKLKEIELKNQHKSKTFIKKELKKIRGKLSYEILINRNDLKDKLKNINRLKNIEVSFAVMDDSSNNAGIFQDWKNDLSTLKYTLSFDKNSKLSKVKQLLYSFVDMHKNQNNTKNYDFEKLKIYAIDEDNKERIYDFFGEPTSFGEMSYDENIPQINLSNFDQIIENNEIIQTLKKIYEEHDFSEI